MAAKPSPQQLAWQDLEIGMFIHFAPNTWQGQQLDNLSTPLEKINPKKLDVKQWVDVAESMSARYIVFVAKHAGGFCMWPTETTNYNISTTPWHGGNGDVCKELAEECRCRAMPLGFYLAPRDDHFGVTTGGKVRSCNSEHQAFYDKIYSTQLTELLTHYGKLVEIWFDGSANGEIVEPIIKKYQPDAVVFQSSAATIRWIGNEEGIAPYPTWNTVRDTQREWTPELDTSESGPMLDSGEGNIWLPAECDVPIRADWFWTSTNEHTLKTLDQLMDIYYRSVGHGCNLLLNHTPDTRGLIPDADIRRAAEFSAEVKRRFGIPLGTVEKSGDLIEVNFDKSARIDHIVTMEDIQHGERILQYQIEALVDGNWKSVARGSAIGHKKIDKIYPITTNKVRFKCIKSTDLPMIRSLAVYGTGS